MEAYQNAALSPEERAKDLLGKMTLQEKVGQLNQRLYGFRIYERQGEEFTLTEEFKEEVERMGGLGVLYGLYRADPWADKDEKTGIVLELSAKAYNIVQKYVIDHSVCFRSTWQQAQHSTRNFFPKATRHAENS